MRLAVLCFALAALALCHAKEVPVLPTEFTATATIAVPFMGSMTGPIYYSLSQGASRLDYTKWGSTYVQLNLLEDVQYNVTCAHGACQCENTTADFPMYSIPPVATYLGEEVVNGVDTEHWEMVMSSRISIDYYVGYLDSDDGRAVPYPVRVVFTMGRSRNQMDFADFAIADIVPAMFNPDQWNCALPPTYDSFIVSGYVYDATNRHVIPGATVVLTNDFHQTMTATADSNGKFTLQDVAEGTSNLAVSANGYLADEKAIVVSGPVAAGTIADVFLSPVLPTGNFRVVLTWGRAPADLDLYDFNQSNCKTYFNNRACPGTKLDIDQRAGYGPETITYQPNTGAHTVVVKRYSSGDLCTSGAKLDLYSATGHQFAIELDAEACAQSGTNLSWNAFAFDTASGTVTVNNSFSN
jgi:hypothetical protein